MRNIGRSKETENVTFLTVAINPGVVRRSFRVALVVGTLLVAINQGDRIFSGQAPDWIKMFLTYCVPYCVATYGAVSAILDEIRNQK